MANDLNYGNPGKPTYDLETNEWTFARTPSQKELRLLGSWNTVINVPINLTTSEVSTSSTAAYRSLKGILGDHPQLAPAAEYVNQFAVVSNAITNTTSAYDPIVGELLSFGSITFEGHFEHPRRVAAMAAGETGSILRLVLLTKERRGWGGDKSIWLEGSSIIDGESGFWNEDAAPIQQISFAQSEDRSAFLAVRLPTRTVLFHPTYHNSRRPAARSPHYQLPSSVIDAHPIVSIGIADTGGVAHADVTFNPGFQSQLGIVDQNGTWSIWDITPHRGNRYSISCLGQSPITSPEDEIPRGEDGWARILWSGDVHTILTCNRRQLSVFDIRGGSITRLPCAKLISEHSADWILDVKRYPGMDDKFYVLTSTYLHVLAVASLSDGADASDGEVGATILTSWRHYRGLEDFTLQLSTQDFSGKDSCVILHSRLNTITTVFRFCNQGSDRSSSLSASDPILLDLAGVNGENSEERRIVHLYLEPLHFGERERPQNLGVGHSYLDSQLKFLRLSAVLSDLSVRYIMLYSHESDAQTHSLDRTFVEPTTWSTIIQPRRTLYAAKDSDELDDFTVPDGLISRSEPSLTVPFQISEGVQQHASRPLQIKIDYKFLYDVLVHANAGEGAEPEPRDILAVLDDVKSLLKENIDTVDPPLGTLLEYGGAEIKVDDIDEASFKLRNASPLDDPTCMQQLQRVGSGQVLGISDSREPSISSLYDSILQNWVAPLPKDIPIRVRQTKERLARRIAAEVILGSTRIRQREGRDDEIQPTTSQDSLLPTIPSSSIPSSSQSQFSLSGPAEPVVLDPLARLRKHLSFDKPFSMPTTIPPSVNQVLQHWQPGMDPRTYEWEITEQILQQAAPDEDSQEQREKARRKKERRERKQKREDEIFRGKSGSQASLPIQLIRSSPGPMLREPASSSQIPMPTRTQDFGGLGPLLVQSQVEQGRHGGRPEKKKKKGKGRIQGF